MLTVLRSAKLDLRLDLAVFSLDGAAKKAKVKAMMRSVLMQNNDK